MDHGKIKYSLAQVVGKRKSQIRKNLIYDEITAKIDQRRSVKNSTTEEGHGQYRQLRNELNRKAKVASGMLLEEQYKDVEDLMNK